MEDNYKRFTCKSDMDKAIHLLEGLLQGIVIDETINKKEAEEVANYCSLHSEFFKESPFDTFLPILLNIEKYNLEDIKGILWVCSNYKNKYYDIITSDLQKLQGIFYGIMADNVIEDIEVIKLSEWIDENKHLSGYYPYDEIHSLLTEVLADGIITKEENNMLRVFFSEFINLQESYNINNLEIRELKENLKISALCAVNPEVVIPNKKFCFTGKSSKCCRNDIANIIETNKGIFHDSVVKDTDYLIVGDEGNPCWVFAAYGRKVEKAIELRKKGCKIIILHENDFWKSKEIK